MMFTVALYVPWSRYLCALGGVRPQFSADNPKCVASDPALLFSAARFTTVYVRLVEQEPPTKCVVLSTPTELRKEMRSGFCQKLVRSGPSNLMSHIDTSSRGWATTLSARVGVAAKDVKAVAVLPGGFGAKLGVVRSECMSSTIHV